MTTIEIEQNDIVILFRFIEMECVGDSWLISAEYEKEIPSKEYIPPTERGDRLEAMVDRMAEKIVDLRRDLSFAVEERDQYREMFFKLQAMITRNA